MPGQSRTPRESVAVLGHERDRWLDIEHAVGDGSNRCRNDGFEVGIRPQLGTPVADGWRARGQIDDDTGVHTSEMNQHVLPLAGAECEPADELLLQCEIHSECGQRNDHRAGRNEVVIAEVLAAEVGNG